MDLSERRPRLSPSARRLARATGGAGRSFRVAATLAGALAATGLSALAPSQEARADWAKLLGVAQVVLNDQASGQGFDLMRTGAAALGGFVAANQVDEYDESGRKVANHGLLQGLASGQGAQIGGDLATLLKQGFGGGGRAPTYSPGSSSTSPAHAQGRHLMVGAKDEGEVIRMLITDVDKMAHDPHNAQTSILFDNTPAGRQLFTAKLRSLEKRNKVEQMRSMGVAGAGLLLAGLLHHGVPLA